MRPIGKLLKSAASDESGQTLIFVALSLTVLMGFMAMAVDVGVLFRAKRNMQIAADAAAVAGALDYEYNASTTSAKAAAAAAATANGVTNGVGGVFVTIDTPPADGPNAGSTGFVEAIVRQPNPTFFMRMFNLSSVTVAARAVAGGSTNSGCIWALGLTGNDIPITGSGTISIPNCDVFDNSDSSNALTLTGSDSRTAKAIGIVGGYRETGSGTISPTVVTMTLQSTQSANDGTKRSIAVQAKAIREGEDGMGFAFMLSQTQDAGRVHHLVSEGVEIADKKNLDHFLRLMLGKKAWA